MKVTKQIQFLVIKRISIRKVSMKHLKIWSLLTMCVGPEIQAMDEKMQRSRMDAELATLIDQHDRYTNPSSGSKIYTAAVDGYFSNQFEGNFEQASVCSKVAFLFNPDNTEDFASTVVLERSSNYQTNDPQIWEEQKFQAGERNLSLYNPQPTVPISDAMETIINSFSPETNWRNRLERNGIVEIRHIETQFILSNNKYGGFSDQLNSLSQIWRIRFAPNENRNVVILENVLKEQCLDYGYNKQLGFSKYNQQTITPAQKWWINWKGEVHGKYYFDIYPYTEKFLRLCVHKGFNSDNLELTSSLSQDTRWCFSPIYSAHRGGWFNKVIVDWGRIIAERHGVVLENEEDLKNVFNCISTDNGIIFEHTSLDKIPQSGTIANLTEDTIIISRKETEEKQKTYQTTFSNEGAISQRQNKLTQNQTDSQLNVDYTGEQTEAVSIHEAHHNGTQKNREDANSNIRKRDFSQNIVSTTNLSSENSTNTGAQISSGEENSVIRGRIREVEESTRKTNIAMRGNSHTFSQTDEKINEIRDTTEDQNTNYKEDTDSRTHNIGGRMYAEASGGADIPFLAKAKAKAGVEAHYDYTNNQQKKTGNSHTRTTSHSKTDTTRNMNNVTDTSFAENTKTDHVENNSRNTDTKSRSQNITNNRVDALDQHKRLGEAKGREFSNHRGDTDTREYTRKDGKTRTFNQESSETRSGGTQIQNHRGASSGASCQHQVGSGQEEERKKHKGGMSSDRGQVTNDESMQFSIPPSTSYQFSSQETTLFKKILQTKLYMHRGPLQFYFSRPIKLNLGSERSFADLQHGNVWEVYPSTILQILPMPQHVLTVHEGGGECCYYGSQEQITETKRFDGKIIEAVIGTENY